MAEEINATTQPDVNINPQEGVSGEIQNTVAPVVEPTTPVDLNGIIPDEYKGKGYLKDVSDVGGLFKKLDGAMSLIGKRPAGIPEDNAPQEDWDKFYKSLGRPDEANGYELELAEGADEKWAEGVKNIFHKAGLNNKQAQIVQKEFDSFIAEYSKNQGNNSEQTEKEFDELFNKTYGDRKDTVMQNATTLLDKYAPKEFREQLKNLDNQQLAAVAGVLDGIQKDYIKEDNITAQGLLGGVSSSDELRSEAIKLMSSPEYTNVLHPNHENVKAKIKELYQQSANMKKGV